MRTWEPPPLVPEPSPRARRTRKLVVVSGAVVVVGVVAGALWWLLGSGGGRDAPVEWDPRVAELAVFVERERDLDFRHAVPVELLADAQWEERLAVDAEALTEEERREAADALELLRALGLAEGDVDLVEQYGEYATNAFLAYYDPEEERITVHANPDEELTNDVRATLVHELVHVLQDQHFDLEAIYDDLDEHRWFAVEALVEGDAVNVEAAWIQTLPEDEQEAIFAAADDAVTALEQIEVPVALQVATSAPYQLGPGFAYLLDARGSGRLDGAFRSLPASDEHVFDPVSYLDGDEPFDVEVPDLPPGAEEIDHGTFGALSWFVVLAERIDAHDAMLAADGWGGDAYVSYREGDAGEPGRVCMQARVVGDRDRDVQELYDALRRWVESLPTAFAKVSLADGGTAVEYHSCDPGAGAALETGRSLDAMALPVTRGQVVAVGIEQGATVGAAQCLADRVVAESTVEELGDPDHEKWSDPAWHDRVRELAVACR